MASEENTEAVIEEKNSAVKNIVQIIEDENLH